MGLDASAKLLRNLLVEKIEPVQNSAQSIYLQYAAHDQPGFENAKEVLYSDIAELFAVIAVEDRQPWMKTLRSWCEQRVDGMTNDQLRNHLKMFLRELPYVENFSIDTFSTKSKTLIDVDALIKEAEEKLKIPDLFDEAFKLVRELTFHEEIDSLRIRSALQEILDTLGSVKNKPTLHKKIALDAIGIVLKNIVAEFAKTTPVLGELTRAAEKSVIEIQDKLALVDTDYAQEKLVQIEKNYEFSTRLLEDKRLGQIEDKREEE